MPIVARCACGKEYHFKDEYAGRRAKCPACGQVVRIPGTRPAGRPSPHSPLREDRRSRTRELALLGSAGFVVLVGIGLVVYFLFFSGPAPRARAPAAPTAVEPSVPSPATQQPSAAASEEPVPASGPPAPAAAPTAVEPSAPSAPSPATQQPSAAASQEPAPASGPPAPAAPSSPSPATQPPSAAASQEPAPASDKNSKDTGLPTETSLRELLMSYPNIVGAAAHQEGSRFGFVTQDSVAKVLAFYSDRLKAQGFTVDDRPSSGSYAPIGVNVGEFRVIQAVFERGQKHIFVEIAMVGERGGSSQVHGNWRMDADSAAKEKRESD